MRIRPCIDIHDGRVKQIVGSTLRESGDACRENFVSARDAGYYAELYRERGLPGGHVILLNPVSDAAGYEADRLQALRALQAYPNGMQIGGGITAETAEKFLEAGASHVIVTSYVFRDGCSTQTAWRGCRRLWEGSILFWIFPVSARRMAPMRW